MTCECQFGQFFQAFKEAFCMPEFPFQSGPLSTAVGNVPASTKGTTATASATANTYGSWVELTPSTPFNAQWALVSLTNNQVASASVGVDIGIGGSGSEVAIIPEIFMRPTAIGAGQSGYLFPVSIPAGSRLSARVCQSGSAAETIDVAINLFSGAACSPGGGPNNVVPYGGAAAISSAQFINVPGTANTDSAWTELTAATVRDHNWFVLSTFSPGGSITTEVRWALDIAIGGAGSEQEIVSDIIFGADATIDRALGPMMSLPIYIPAGSRIAVRARSTATGAAARQIYAKLYGC